MRKNTIIIIAIVSVVAIAVIVYILRSLLSPALPEQTPKAVNTPQEVSCVSDSGLRMFISEAKTIVANSECSQTGILKGSVVCNPNTATWWLSLEPGEPKAGCDPACVVSLEKRTAEVNWRCTGALPPLNGTSAGTCSGMSLGIARKIAVIGSCAREGTLTGEAVCNDNTDTWWLGFTPNKEQPGCDPACVVNAKTGVAEVNWRCTGLIPR